MDPSSQLKVILHNVENLFIFLDKYNGEDLNKIDEQTWQDFSASLYTNKSLKKTFELATTFLVSNPDVIMLTEVGGPQSLDNFNKYFLEDKYDSYIIEGNSERGIDLGYLVKKDLPFTTKVKSHKKRPLMFLYPGSREKVTKKNSLKFSRDVLELRLLDDSKKVNFVFLLVHLKSKLDKSRKDLEGRARRKAELDCLVEIFKEIKLELPETPIALAGDFNGIAGRSDTEPEFDSIYSETNLEDFTQLLNIPMDERYSYIHFDKTQTPYKMQLDYFFLESKFIPMLNEKGCQFINFRHIDGEQIDYPKNFPQKQQLPSDHYPIEISFYMQFHPFFN